MEAFKRQRATEIEHGRASTLAALGCTVPDGHGFDDYLSPPEGGQSSGVRHGLATTAAGWREVDLAHGRPPWAAVAGR